MTTLKYKLTKELTDSLVLDVGHFQMTEATNLKTMRFEIDLKEAFMSLIKNFPYPDVTFTFQNVSPAAQPAVNGNPEAKFRLKIDDLESPALKTFTFNDLYTISAEPALKDLRNAMLSVDVEYYDNKTQAFVSKRNICIATPEPIK
ncbi:MAG: hypothetical protein MHMPM18_000305 [Marteilia pararefringens]